MLGQGLFDAILDRLVLRTPRHFVKPGAFFDLCTAGCGGFLHSRFVGFVRGLGGYGCENNFVHEFHPQL